MAGLFNIFKNNKGDTSYLEETEYEEFMEISSDINNEEEIHYLLKPVVVQEYMDLKIVSKLLREGNYIVLINLKPLKVRDSVELKRVVQKLKQMVENINGDIIGFGDGNWVIVMPPGIKVDREKREEEDNEE